MLPILKPYKTVFPEKKRTRKIGDYSGGKRTKTAENSGCSNYGMGNHRFERKPVTIVYDNPKGLPKELLAEDGSIGIRLVKDDFVRS